MGIQAGECETTLADCRRSLPGCKEKPGCTKRKSEYDEIARMEMIEYLSHKRVKPFLIRWLGVSDDFNPRGR
jgi:hypothetical protein